MSSDFYKLGAESAWNRYLVNPAKRLGTALFSTTRAPADAGTARQWGTAGLNMLREGTFGSPIDVYKTIRGYGNQGGKFSLGKGLQGLYREHFLPSDTPPLHSLTNFQYPARQSRLLRMVPKPPPASWGAKALSGGMRALPLAFAGAQLYGAAQDPEHRGENIGGAIASLAGAPLTGRLGIPGMMLQAPITAAGRAVGRMFQRQPALPRPDPRAQYYHALQGGLAQANTYPTGVDTVPA